MCSPKGLRQIVLPMSWRGSRGLEMSGRQKQNLKADPRIVKIIRDLGYTSFGLDLRTWQLSNIVEVVLK